MAQEDVQAESSPAEPSVDAQSGGVTSEPGSDRPVQNTVGEFNRRFAQMKEQNEQILRQLQYLAATQQQAPAAPAAPRSGAPTDEELWGLAQQGNREAFEEYQRRIARREVQQTTAVQQQAQMVNAQLQALFTRYPALGDQSHPLGQAAQSAYQQLVAAGYPANRQTQLAAFSATIVDRPDIVSEIYQSGSVARESGRRSASQVAMSGQTGGTVRQEPARTAGTQRQLSAEEIALAKRMGLSPEKAAGARDRFKKRLETPVGNNTQQSNLGQIGMMVREEDL